VSSHHRHEPADPGDVRFEVSDIGAETEDSFMQVLVLTVDDRGEVVGRDVFPSHSEAFDMIEACREVQAVPLEERFAMYAERGW
jgi:hypothetical protein